MQWVLRGTMQETCGVVRSEEKLGEGLKRIAEVRVVSDAVDVRPTSEGFGDLAYAPSTGACVLYHRPWRPANWVPEPVGAS